MSLVPAAYASSAYSAPSATVPTTLSLGSAVVPNQLMVARVQFFAATNAVPSDAVSGTWNVLKAPQMVGGVQQSLFWVQTGGSGTPVFSIANTVGIAKIELVYVNGFQFTPLPRVADAAQNSGTGTALSSGNVTGSQINEIFFAWYCTAGGAYTGGGSWSVATGNTYYESGVASGTVLSFAGTLSASDTWRVDLQGFYDGGPMGVGDGNSGGVNTLYATTGTYGNPVPAVLPGDIIDALGWAQNNHGQTCAIHDTAGCVRDTDWVLVDQDSGAAFLHQFSRWKGLVTTAGSPVIRFTYGVTDVLSIMAMPIRGADPVTPFNAANFVHNTMNSSASPGVGSQTTNLTPTLALPSGFAVAWMAALGPSNTSVPTGNWRTLGNFGAQSGVMAMVQHLTSAAPIAGTATPPASTPFDNFIGVYNDAPSSGAVLGGSATDTSAASAAINTAIALVSAATDASTAVAPLINWSTVTLLSPLYSGVGGALDPNFWLDVVPVSGITLYYDGTYITIATDGEISSTSNNCSALVQFNNGSGWALGLIVITPYMVGYADTATLAAGALTSGSQLVAAASTIATAAGALSTHIQMASPAVDAVTAAALLATQPSLSAAGADLTSAIGVLTTAIQLAAAALETANATGSLNTGALLAAGAADVSTGRGALTTGIPLSGAGADALTAAGKLLGPSASLSGAASDTVSAAAVLSTQISLAAAAADVVSAYGSASTQIQLAADSVNASFASGALATGIFFQGVGFDTSSASGQLNTKTLLAGASIDLLTASATLITQIQLIGMASDASSAQGNLLLALEGAGYDTSSGSADLTTLQQEFSQTIWVLGV